MAALLWNQWQLCRGLSGNFGVEPVATLPWNRWQLSRGIRTDEDVLAIARKERRILLVADRDFGELIFHQELAHAGVIFFRLPGASLQTKIDHLNTVLADYTEQLKRGEFIVVTPGRIRVATRPHP